MDEISVGKNLTTCKIVKVFQADDDSARQEESQGLCILRRIILKIENVYVRGQKAVMTTRLKIIFLRLRKEGVSQIKCAMKIQAPIQ
jgi:hypothetical protein